MEIDPEFTHAGHLPTILQPDGNRRAADQCDGSDVSYMKLALRRAMEATGLADPNPTVGCLIVKDGIIIATGSTLAMGDLHAERVALKQASDHGSTRGATLYCTMEPCSHTGRQPPCCEAIAAAGISKCVVGVQDTDSRVNGRGLAYLRNAGITVKAGVLHEECALWHLPFLLRQGLNRPFIALKWAQTLDGQLAYDAGAPQWISGQEAARYSHWLRQRYDAIVIGANTALNDLARLNVRYFPFKKYRDPVRIMADATGRLIGSSRWEIVLEAALSAEGAVIYLGPAQGDGPSIARMEQLKAQGNVIVKSVEEGQTVVQAILSAATDGEVEQKFGRPIKSLMVEGGPRLHQMFLKSGLVDVAHVVVAAGFGSGSRHRVMPDWPPGQRLITTGAYKLGNDMLMEMASISAVSMVERQVTRTGGIECQIAVVAQ